MELVRDEISGLILSDVAIRAVGGWVDKWVDRWVDEWMGAWVDGWVRGWVGGWEGGQMVDRSMVDECIEQMSMTI